MEGFQNLKYILLNNFYVCGPTSMNLFITTFGLQSKEGVVAEWWLLEFCPLTGFQILPFLKSFVTDFSGTMKARKLKVSISIGFQILPFLKIFVTDFSGSMKATKLKVCTNMDNDWMYRVYWNRGQGP